MLEINVCEIFSQACCHQGAPVEQIGPFYHFSEASEGNRTENSFKLIQIYSTLIRSELSTVESKALRILYKGLKVGKIPTFDYVVVFIGPESDHWLCLSLIHTLTHSPTE